MLVFVCLFILRCGSCAFSLLGCCGVCGDLSWFLLSWCRWFVFGDFYCLGGFGCGMRVGGLVRHVRLF